MRAERSAGLALMLVLAACAGPRGFVRPDGDGGWSRERRREELDERAKRSGVDFALAAPAATIAAAPKPLDLAGALERAGRGNRRIAEAEHGVSMARERVDNTRGRLLPATVGSGRYTWYTDPQTNQIPFPPGIFQAAQRPEIVIRDSEVGLLNGTITLPIDLSGEIRHALAAAQAGYRGEQARLWATTLEQRLAVIRAYFDLLVAERLRAVTEETIAADRKQLATAESQYQNGRLTKNQLLVVQVALQNSGQQLVQRRLAVARARWALNQAIGEDGNAPTEAVDVESRPALPSVDEALRVAYERNPVLRSLLEEQQRLEETTRSLARGRLPRLSAGGAIDTSSSDILQPQDVGSGFVGFIWDLGTDGRREAEIAEAKIAADRNRIQLERQLRELEALVRTTQQAGEERLSALAAAETAVGQAEENLRIRQQQFEAGRAQSEDVLDAEALLSQQRATRAGALYQAHVRHAELRQLMGESLDASTLAVPGAVANQR